MHNENYSSIKGPNRIEDMDSRLMFDVFYKLWGGKISKEKIPENKTAASGNLEEKGQLNTGNAF